MFFRALLIVALAALPGCNWQPYSRSVSGVSALDKKVLYDFRDTSSPGVPKLDKATEHRVFTAVSPHGNIYDNLVECGNDEEGVLLNLTSVATGSFTAPGAKESAFLVHVTKCGETMAEMGADVSRLLVFRGEQLVASAESRCDTILKTYDLNGDGISELLLDGGWAHGGEATSNAVLVRFDKKALITIENFGTVYHDVCGLIADVPGEHRQELAAKGIDPVAEAVVISYLPRPGQQMPNFVAERYRASCPANFGDRPANWQRVGDK